MLTKQQYALIKVMEEAAEIQQACAKALRFGLDDINPHTKLTARMQLACEFGDFQIAVDKLDLSGFDAQDRVAVENNMVRGLVKYNAYLEYSQNKELTEK